MGPRVIAAPRAHLITLVVGHFHANAVVASIEDVILRLIGNRILVAKLVADILKRLVEIIYVVGEECAAAGLFGKVLEDLVSVGQVIFAVGGFFGIRFLQGDPLGAGADGVNDHAGALGQLNGFRARVRGQIVFAIADENHHAANHIGLVSGGTRRMVQLFRTSFIDGVVNRRAAARARSYDLIAQRSRIAGEPLED